MGEQSRLSTWPDVNVLILADFYFGGIDVWSDGMSYFETPACPFVGFHTTVQLTA
jgi:hypothetical protein